MYRIFLITGVLLCVTAQFAVATNAIDSLRIELKPFSGLSIQKTSFNISGNEQGTNPNILSELIWNNTIAVNIGSEVQMNYKRLQLKTAVNFSHNLSGAVSDIDYKSDNRNDILKETHSSNHKGLGYKIYIQPAYIFPIKHNENIALAISYQYMANRNYILNKKDLDVHSSNYIEGLNSYYQYKFPLLGLAISYDKTWNKIWQIHIQAQTLYTSKYYGYGNWNSREEFQQPISFEHKGNGRKKEINAAISRLINLNLAFKIAYNWDAFYLNKNGKDYLYPKVGDIILTKLNEVEINQHYFQFGINYKIK